MQNNRRIIISMTSWPNRICNVSHTVNTLLCQTVKPDSIELNLSVEEFPNQLADLPSELLTLHNANKLCINWVQHNTKVFKKFIPVLQKYYDEDYYLLTVDDDCLYNSTYVETMIKQLADFDYYCLIDNRLVIGYCMIYKSTCFKNDFWTLLSDELIRLSIDDYFTESYLKLNNKIESNNAAFEKAQFITAYNEVFPNSITGVYDMNRIIASMNETRRILQNVR